MGWLNTTNPELGSHGQEIHSFGQFMPKAGDFR
jgi:hypothetical protein